MTSETKKYLFDKANEQVAHNIVMHCLRNNINDVATFFFSNQKNIDKQVSNEYESLIKLWNEAKTQLITQ